MKCRLKSVVSCVFGNLIHSLHFHYRESSNLFVHLLVLSLEAQDSLNNAVKICSKIIDLHSLWKNRSVQKAKRIIAIINHDDHILSEEFSLIPSGRYYCVPAPIKASRYSSIIPSATGPLNDGGWVISGLSWLMSVSLLVSYSASFSLSDYLFIDLLWFALCLYLQLKWKIKLLLKLNCLLRIKILLILILKTRARRFCCIFAFRRY